MEHPDFRVAGKIFATLEYPDEDFAISQTRSRRLALPQQLVEGLLFNR
jgi:hypothetical protein